jgi:type IV secretion system protein VirD4
MQPSARRRLAGLFLGLIAACLQVSTQLCAADFDYQPALGLNVRGIYPPWAIVVWAHRWSAEHPGPFTVAAQAGVAVFGLGLLALLGIQRAMHASNPYLHGSARWAELRDLKAAGLLPGPSGGGVYVGAHVERSGKVRYLRHDGPEHVLCYAPTRSGKGVGLVVPTLLSWPASAFVTDLKGELWELTAGWRERGAHNHVLRFEPAAQQDTVRWNPLSEIRLGTPHEVGDVQNLATLLVDPDGKGLESHWQKTSQALLVGVVLHALYKANDEDRTATLAEVDELLADPERPVGDLWQQMLSYPHIDGQCHPVAAAAARDMIDRPVEEAGSVLSTAKSYLSLYRDPIIRHNTSASDFQIRDLMHDTVPRSLYLVTQPTDKDRLRPLVRILVNMVLRVLADKVGFEGGRPKPLYKHRLLLMLDEFTALRRLAILQESLAFIAGYGIKAYLICQDIKQLRSAEEGYGRDETITSNCHIQVAMPPNGLETAEHLSRLTGQTSVRHQQISRNGMGLFASASRTEQWIQRPLLTPDECLRLAGPEKDEQGQITRPGAMLVFAAGCPAIYGRQPLYFQDAVFQARARIPSPRVH